MLIKGFLEAPYLLNASQSVFHLRTSFPRDLRNEMSFSQDLLHHPAAVPYLLQSMARDKADDGRGDFRLMIKGSRRGIATVVL